jgi:microcystin-dependent protein
MGYTEPKTWNFKETLSSTDLNVYLTANMIALKKNNPIGEVKIFGGDTVPEGFLFCRGQAIDRTDYANLYDVIGTYFGVGDGSTTFNLPDTQGRAIFGVSTTDGTFDLGDTGGSKTINTYHRHAYVHTHTYDHTHIALRYNTQSNGVGTEGTDWNTKTISQSDNVTSDPNTSYTSYTGSTTLNSLNPFVAMNFIIKY